LLASIAGIALSALCITLAGAPLRRHAADPVTGDKDISNVGVTAAIPVVFVFTMLSAQNVSLVWVKITDNALRMKQNAHIDLISYRRAVLAYYAIISAAVIGTLIAR